jgi:mycothiol synthase
VSTASVKALPRLDGVEFRGFRGPSDYPHFARIITAWAQGAGDDRVETAEGIASGYENLQRCDPFQDLVVVEIEEHPVAYSRVWWAEESGGPHLYEHACFVDPEFGGRGIGKALFAWNEARLREIASEHAVDEQLFEVWANDRNVAATALIRDAGYEPITYSADMVRPSVDDLPDHSLPEGLEIRPVREEDIRIIWEADVEAFRDHWGFVEHTEADYQRFLAYPYLDPTLWKIAWDDEGVAGQVKSFIDTAQNEAHGKRRGWTEAISTSRRWRRRGVAKALIVESIRELAARGMTEVALGVHTENPNGAYDLYAGLGYEVTATWTTYRKAL